MAKPHRIKWLADPADEDYEAARSYMSLILDEEHASKCAKKLSKRSAASFRAKDIFRASGLPLLDSSDYHVDRDRRKIVAGKPLSPLLLVRAGAGAKLIIADGYHRLCAVYSYDEDALIPCRIV